MAPQPGPDESRAARIKAAAERARAEAAERQARQKPSSPNEPTRYGDWEKRGLAIDF